MSGGQTESALARIEGALARIERSATRLREGQADLDGRHARLKIKVSEALAEIDRLVEETRS